MMAAWTKEREDLVRKLWGAGASAQAIADRLGGAFSRNAVIGKAHRLGLHRRDAPQRRLRKLVVPNAQMPGPKSAPARSPTPAVAMRLPAGGGSRHEFRAPVEEPTQDYEVFVPVSQRKGLVDLDDHDCRWPIGDPRGSEFHFCGARKVQGLSYCAHHVARSQSGVVVLPPPPPRPAPVVRQVEEVKADESELVEA